MDFILIGSTLFNKMVQKLNKNNVCGYILYITLMNEFYFFLILNQGILIKDRYIEIIFTEKYSLQLSVRASEATLIGR